MNDGDKEIRDDEEVEEDGEEERGREWQMTPAREKKEEEEGR